MVILGRQGSGKGTQSLRLAAQYGCVHLSTGDVLRAAVEEGTELGQQAAGIMNAGGLVGDDVMIPLVAERVAKPDIMSGGVLLDGFPRTADQASGSKRCWPTSVRNSRSRSTSTFLSRRSPCE